MCTRLLFGKDDDYDESTANERKSLDGRFKVLFIIKKKALWIVFLFKFEIRVELSTNDQSCSVMKCLIIRQWKLLSRLTRTTTDHDLNFQAHLINSFESFGHTIVSMGSQ